MRQLVSLLLLSCGALGAAELPPLAEQASTWARGLGHGAIATAEKRDGKWTFAIAGQPFAAGHAEVPAERVLATNQPTAAELQPLQGTWEGFMAGNEADGKITITITGNSLHFHRDTNFWFETTFTLPAGTYPQQLHATIKDCPQPCDDIGKVVFAIFKIEEGTLTLVGIQASAVEPPKTFGEFPEIEDNRFFRYRLKKVQPSIFRDELKQDQPQKHAAEVPSRKSRGHSGVLGPAWADASGRHLG